MCWTSSIVGCHVGDQGSPVTLSPLNSRLGLFGNIKPGRCEDEWFIKIYYYHRHCLLPLETFKKLLTLTLTLTLTLILPCNYTEACESITLEPLNHCSSHQPKTGHNLITLPPVGGRGIVFARFLSLFLCQQHYKKTAGPICVKFSGKVWSDHGTT